MHVAREKAREIKAAHERDNFFSSTFVQADTGLPVLAPQGAHHVVERACALGCGTNVQVECQRHQRAFGVIAGNRVGGVLVLPVILGPRIKARLSHALFQLPRAAPHGADGFGESREVLLLREQAGAHQHQVVVVGSEALEEPQLARVIFLA